MCKNIYVAVATESELELVKSYPFLDDVPKIITGVGPCNVIRALRDLPRDAHIFNVGYAGSVDLPIGETFGIGKVSIFHKIPFNTPEIVIGSGVKCLSSTDFVTESQETGCVFDMELAFICALGFNHVTAYKKVSDHCNYEEYESNTSCSGIV